MLPWDDLRTVLAIAATGSLSGAARQLRVNHATVFRRLHAIEERVGTALFVRGRDGYAATPAGEDLAATARRIEHEVLDVERRLQGMDLQPLGTVGVTTTDTLLAGMLSDVFAGFQADHPGIDLEIPVTNQVFNLSRREADVAIRPGNTPPEALVGRRVGTLSLAIYAPQSWSSESTDRPMDALPWVGADERMGYQALEAWMTTQGLAKALSLPGRYHAWHGGCGPIGNRPRGAALLPCRCLDRSCPCGRANTRAGN